MSYGMIGYVVPHSIYPKGYQCNPKVPLPFVNLGSQKNHMAFHLMCCYGDPKLKAWFEKAWKDAGKKFDMGGGCVRFKKLEDVPLEVIGQLVASLPVDVYIRRIEKVFAENAEARAAKKTAKAKPSENETHEEESSEIAGKVPHQQPHRNTPRPHRFAPRPRSCRRAALGEMLKAIFASQAHDRTRTVATGRRTSPSLCSKSS